MKIVVASGKGGTGKTLVSTSLALIAAEEAAGGGHVALVDADVEAPNAALFLRPTLTATYPVEKRVPCVSPEVCTHCGRCSEVCRYHAIAALPARTLVFPELCHGCGSCTANCPAGAIEEVAQEIGVIEAGSAGDLAFARGVLHIGEAMATPVIRAVKRYARDQGWSEGLLLFDAPPGTACPVIETLRGSDVALLVTEPTPFGLHDLRLAVQVAQGTLGLPTGIVINKDGTGYDGVEEYCRDEGLPVWMRIPLRRDIAAAYSTGQPLVQAFPEYRAPLRQLLHTAIAAAERRTA